MSRFFVLAASVIANTPFWTNASNNNVLVRILGQRVIEYHNPSFFLRLANGTTTVKELIRVKVLSAGTNQRLRWTVEMNEDEAAFSGHDSILPEEKKDLLFRNHGLLGKKTRARSRRNYTTRPKS